MQPIAPQPLSTGFTKEMLSYEPSTASIKTLQLKSDYTVPEGKKLLIFSAYGSGTKNNPNVSATSAILLRNPSGVEVDQIIDIDWSGSSSDTGFKEELRDMNTSPFEVSARFQLDFRNSNLLSQTIFASCILVDRNISLKF